MREDYGWPIITHYMPHPLFQSNEKMEIKITLKVLGMKVCLTRVFYLISLFVTCQCNEASNSQIPGSGSINLKPKENARQDSEGHPTNTVDEDISTDDILNEYVKGYREKVVFDTVYVAKTDTFQIGFTHYCLLDSGITVPVKYVSIYELNQFITHNFQSRLIFKKNNKVIVDKIISKKQFNEYLDEPLKKYGVLLYPEMSVKSTRLEINYSISIPLTDIGIQIGLTVSDEGKIEIKKY